MEWSKWDRVSGGEGNEIDVRTHRSFVCAAEILPVSPLADQNPQHFDNVYGPPFRRSPWQFTHESAFSGGFAIRRMGERSGRTGVRAASAALRGTLSALFPTGVRMIRWTHRAAALAFSTSLLAPVALA
ncbi:hypothetical protein ACQUWY_27690, partial [Ralstonia pseudosolanacearum]